MARVRRRPLQPTIPRQRVSGVLHHLAALLNLAGRRSQTGNGAPQRRRRQRLSLAQRLLDPLPQALRAPDQGAELFWRAIRWGGPGLLLGCWLLR
jgi:hypothetical protein